MKTTLLVLGLLIGTGLLAQDSNWKSGIELGTGLSFTGYNANLAYTGNWGNNVLFIGPKIVYSDANTLFDTPWGIHSGYRRIFPIGKRFEAFMALTYQAIFFKYAALKQDQLNSIQELHISYGFQWIINEHYRIGQSIGAGGYLERLIDPFDGRVDKFSGYSAQVRLFGAYIF